MKAHNLKRCLTSSEIREMQIKSIMGYYCTSTRLDKVKKTNHGKCGRGCRTTKTLIGGWWKCKIVQQLWKSFGIS